MHLLVSGLALKRMLTIWTLVEAAITTYLYSRHLQFLPAQFMKTTPIIQQPLANGMRVSRPSQKF
jgi:hypothetical protein